MRAKKIECSTTKMVDAYTFTTKENYKTLTPGE
jgi:hypothetical protein